jgi:predicted Zn-dependent peptidase
MFIVKELKNNAKLILAPRKETDAVTLLVMFKVGSRFETRNNNGVSHFIEHLYFKGTRKRPDTFAISQELDKVGAQFNAFTGKDYTGYYIKVAKHNIELAFDVLSDMLFHSKFDSKEINRERGVIIEEIRMYKDNPLMYIGDLLEQISYKGHSLAREIAGPETVITKISRQDILKYKDEHYRSDNMIIGVGGNYSQAKLNKLIDKYFGKKFGKKQEHKFDPFISKQAEPRVKVQYKQTAQVQLAMGFPGVGRLDKKYMTQLLLSIILGGNMSSRLFISIRERHGLAYSVRTGIDDHADSGLFSIQAGLKKDKLALAYKLIVKELSKIKKIHVSEGELKKAKDFIKGKLVLGLEDSFDYVYWLVHQMVDFGEARGIKSIEKEIDKVTSKQIQELANEIFINDKLNLAIIGPYKDSLYFNKLIKQQKI